MSAWLPRPVWILVSASIISLQAVHVFSRAAESQEQPNSSVSYARDIRPIFQAKCQGCHQPAKAAGEYVMTSMDQLLAGGESGAPAIVPSNPDDSYLMEMITPVDGQAEMPKDDRPLSVSQLRMIRDWIGQGARDDLPARESQYDRDHPPRYVRLPAITSLDYSPDGQLLAVPGYHEVALYSADGSQLIARLIGVSPRIESVRFSPDGTKLAVTGGSLSQVGEVQIWDVPSHELQLSVPVALGTVRGACWSDDSKLLAFGCADNSVRAIDVETGQTVLRQASHNDLILGTAFSRDAGHVASVSRDTTAKLVEVASQQLADNITAIADGAWKGGLQCVVRHPLRDEILFGGADGVPYIYKMFRTVKRQRDGDENLLWKLPPLPGRIFGVDISEDGCLIAAGSSRDGSGAVYLYAMDAAPDIPTEIQTILERPPGVRDATETRQLQEHFDRAVKVIARIEFAASGVFAVAIDPTSQRVAAAGSDGMIRLLDASSGQVVGQFAPFERTGPSSDRLVANADGLQSNAGLVVPLPPEPLPEDVGVVRLHVFPETIQLPRRTDYAQVIVLAELSTGEVIDATRIAKLTTESPLVTVSSTAVVRPLADGSTQLSAVLGSCSAAIPIQVTGASQPLHPDFVRDVSPVLSRLGCNVGKCHGARLGKNGFKLSLRGYDPIFDIRALTDDLAARRINLASPADSLMLAKPSAAVPHEGGQLLQPDSDYNAILHAWIADGAKLERQSADLARLDVYPANPVVQHVGSLQQLRVVAVYGDGQHRDVTREAFIESGNATVAKEIEGYPGLVEVLQRGEAPILVRFQGNYAATTLTVMGDRDGFVWKPQPSNNPIDDFVWDKLKRTETLPSPLCDDYEFVRRVALDLTGLPPRPDEIRAFVNDSTDTRSKRDASIDRLVGSPDYVEFRTNKWADLLQVNGKFLGRAGATKLRRWIRQEIADNTPYDEFARKILTASGSNKDNPAAAYYKILRDPQKLMANTTHLFLATRFTCNECHDHPFERWTQDDFYQLSSWFAQVGFRKDEASGDKKIKTSATEPDYPLYEIVFDKNEGHVIHQRTQEIAEPAFPFDCQYEVPPNATRREEIAAWITSPDNPYFARSYANRIWGYLTGRGLIEPLDDIRAGNPATNPELLDYLTREFIDSGFDTQHLFRLICKSRVYQLSSETNRWNADDTLNYSHAQPRRLPAEVIYDAIYQTTGATSEFPGVPEGTRAAALPDVGIKLPDDFLSNMGRPARESSCECERNEELQLGVVLALVNCPTVNSAIGATDNAVAELAAAATTDGQLVDEMFLRVLNRPARTDEMEAALRVFPSIDSQHEQLAQQLRTLEEARAADRAEKESQRLAELEQVKHELRRYQEQQASIFAERRQQRELRVDEAKVALRSYEDELPEKLRRWAQEHRHTTCWTPLDPLELIADTEPTVLSLQADKSILVEGPRGKGAYRLLARTNLRGISGIRIDAFASERFEGPERKVDNIVLTELEVERAPADLDSATVLSAWDFDSDPGTWKPLSNNKLSVNQGRLTVKSMGAYPAMATRVFAPAGSFALEIVAKINRRAMMRLYWSTTGMADYDKTRSHRHGVVAGEEPWRRYRFHFDTSHDLTGIRLDLDRKDGQVQVESIRLLRCEANLQSVVLKNPIADNSQDGFEVGQAIDGNKSDSNGWSVSPNGGQAHAAVFETQELLGAEEDSLIQVVLHQNFSDGQSSLGRFRVSVTNSPKPLSFGLPEPIFNILAIDRDKRSANQCQELADYFRANDTELQRLEQALRAAQEPLPEDPMLVRLQNRIQSLSQPLPVDRDVARLRKKINVSQQQLSNKRLTAAQDLAWALINNPEFLFNH